MASTSDPIVQFRNIGKTYDGKSNVLEGLNLDIEQGEFVTLLGASGSGKTTLLMILAGFEAATEGEVLLNGRPLARLPAYKRNMGVVFQNYALFPHMSVGKNVAYPLIRRGLPKEEIRTRVDEVLNMIHMREFSDRLPAQLSGGQQQRVALARAIVYRPDVILMDEPLGALDKNLRETMQLEIKRLHSQLGTTVVYVTHDQSEALTMSDRIAVFEKGKILQVGSPSQIYERPLSSYVANFIGDINNISGEVIGVENGICRMRTPDGTEIRGADVLGAEVGASMTLAVRPENVCVKSGEHEGLRGEISDVIYHGDHVRYEVSTAALGSLVVRGSTDEALMLRRKDQVSLTWDEKKARVLDARGDIGCGAS